MKKIIGTLVLLACLAIVVALNAYKKEQPQEMPYTIRIVVTGDSQGQGNGIYGNGKMDEPLDFYNQLKKEDKVILTTADKQNYQMLWDDKSNGFVAVFPPLKGDQPLHFAVRRPSPEPTAPEGWLDPVYGIYADVLSKSGKILTTTELVHYEDKTYSVSSKDKIWSVIIDGVNLTTGQIRQREDNRTAEISISGDSQ